MGPGMMSSMGGWPWIGWLLGVALLILLVWIIIRFVAGPVIPRDGSPEQILKRRYARGEMDHGEYDRRLDDLRR
jgi:putative membrane protein